jgi:uncharacterized membrane protein
MPGMARTPAPPLTPTTRTEPTPIEQTSRLAAVVAAAALLALSLAWELGLGFHWGWALVKVLPLAPALPGLWRYRLYTYRWVSLLVWAYVTDGLVHATSSSGMAQVLGGVEVALAVGLFVAVTVHIRHRLAAARAAQARPA